MAARAAVRASDVDRESVAERLREAAGEGRLRTEELEERLEVALSARTYGELDWLVRDLPGRGRRVPMISPALAIGATALAMALVLTVVVVVAIAVLFIVTGVFTGWLLWLLAAWFFFGRRRRISRLHAQYGRSLHRCGGWSASRPPRYWA